MPFTSLNIGSGPDTGDGDNLRTGGDKLNAMLAELYAEVATFLLRGGDTMTGPLLLSADPSAALGAATKQYVDNVKAGQFPKDPVLCATTANITLSGEQTIDGITTSASRVLVKNQTSPSQNGIYLTRSGAWSRVSDMSTWARVPGAQVNVEEGTTNADSVWMCTADPGGTLETTAITWSKLWSAGVYQLASAVLSFLAGAATADAAGLQALLSLVPGTNVQAFSAVLAFLATSASPNAAGVRALLGDAIGAERVFAGSPGAGWLLCDGAVYNQSAYPALFAAIGAIPDLATQSFVQPAGSAYVHYRCIWVSSLGLYVCATGNGIYTASTPTGTWTQRATGDFRDVEWSGSLLSAVGANGICSTSTDGITWTSRAAFNGGSGTALTLSYGGGVWHLTVTGGTAAGLYSATDGYTFTQRVAQAGFSSYHRVRYGASTWVITYPGTNAIKYSSDGSTWSDAAVTGAIGGASLFSCAFNGTEFVALGQSGEVLASADGHTWAGRQSYLTNFSSSSNPGLQLFWDGEDLIYPTSSASMTMSRDGLVTGYVISFGKSIMFNTTIAVAPPALNNGTMVFPTASTNGLFVVSKYSYDKTTQMATPRIAPVAGSVNHRTYIRAL